MITRKLVQKAFRSKNVSEFSFLWAEKYLPYEEARAIVQGFEIENLKDWKNFCKNGTKPLNIPNCPDSAYKNRGWKNWYDWLGTKKYQYLSFKEARAFVRKLKIRSTGWREYCLTERPANIPANPSVVYKNGWKNWFDWLGNKAKNCAFMGHRDFETARRFVRSLGFKNYSEWAKYCHSGKKPIDIPTNLARAYADEGWKGMSDWLGIKQRVCLKARPFKKARSFVQELKFQTAAQWIKFCESGKKPIDIPKYPYCVYEKEWKGMADWLGRNSKRHKSFKHARDYIRRQGLRSSAAWTDFCESGKKPLDIPATPYLVYKKEWKGMQDWLGAKIWRRYNYNRVSFEDARKYARALKLRTMKEWFEFCRCGNKLSRIPTAPNQVYTEWKNWSDWLGTIPYSIRKRKRKVFRPFEDARLFVRGLKLKTGYEWKRIKNRPLDIPANPCVYYRGKGWIDYYDWIGVEKSRKNKFSPFKKARYIAREQATKLGLKTMRDWYAYYSNRAKKDIPCHPDRVYKEWVSWHDWLGIGIDKLSS